MLLSILGGGMRQGFNRTFMELKYPLEWQYVKKGAVLIVPLWN